jgi:hypothetical protein
MIPISEIEKVIAELEQRFRNCTIKNLFDRADAHQVAITLLKELLPKNEA